MTDTMTRKPLRVRNEGTAGPYFMLPVSQLEDVRQLFDSHQIRYWVDQYAISWNGGPETTIINLGREGDAAAVQAVLDSVSSAEDFHENGFCYSITAGLEEGQTMTDIMTKKPLSVRNEGTAGPYIMLPVSQLDEVKQLLNSHQIHYWVAVNAVSWNGAPETTIINLGRGGDAAAVQAILDSVR